MPVMMVVVWFVSVLSGTLVSLALAIPYVSTSGNAVLMVFAGLATATWVFALVRPLSFPVYKGVLPALFPMIGLLAFGLIGFAAGWLAVAICHAIADARRFARLCEMTGGAPPTEIVPLLTVGIVVAGLVIGAWIAKAGCPMTRGGEKFLLDFTFRYFMKQPPDATRGAQLMNAIPLIGSFFAGTRQFFVCMMALLFARPQVPRMP